jgi:hypothetical protein
MMMDEWWIAEDLEAAWPIRGTNPEFVWREWGKPRESSFSVGVVPVEIRIKHLVNTSSEIYDYANVLSIYVNEDIFVR